MAAKIRGSMQIGKYFESCFERVSVEDGISEDTKRKEERRKEKRNT